MSVLIKGMKMPTSCYDCNCFIRDSDGSDYCCLLMQNIKDNDKRDDDCPIVPVSPHGRLIDADVMMKDICDSIDAMTRIGIVVDGDYLWAKFNDALYNAPTVIPAEESE